MNHSYKLMLFSPQHSDLDTLSRTITEGRRLLANDIMETLREFADTGRPTHYLLIGPRGCGKTHLLAYIWKNLEKPEYNGGALNIYRLSEEERGIISLFDILLAALRSTKDFSEEELLQQTPIGNPSEALRIIEEIFLKHAGDRPSIIIVENTEIIFRGLKKKGQSSLRGFLQTHTNISLLASSIELFGRSQSKDHPFYGFFLIEHLKQLNAEDARKFLIMLARLNGETALANALQKDEARKRVRAIYALTGGSHRLLAMLSCFLSNKGLEELVQPFIRLMDRELTPYYQQRLDRLSPQQNKILSVIAQQGGAISVKEIAEKTYLQSQTVSGQLHDMLHGNFVRRRKAGRESYYELKEPLLRIVLDIKESRSGPLPLIVNLLRNWYEAEDLKKLEAMAPEFVKEYYRAALDEVQQIGGDGISLGEFEQKEKALTSAEREFDKLLKEGIAWGLKGDYEKAIDSYNKVLERSPDHPWALLLRASSLHLMDELKPALEELDRLIDLLSLAGDSGENMVVAGALFEKGIVLDRLNRPEEAISVYDEVVERFGGSEELELLGKVAGALVSKGTTLGRANKHENAIVVFDEVVERFGGGEEPGLLVQVARALVNKGNSLRELERHEDAIAVYDGVVDRFSGSEEKELLVQVAGVLVNKGFVLNQLERHEDAIAIFDEVVGRFGGSEESELLEPVARALFNKGFVLNQLERHEDATAIFDEVVGRFGGSEETELLEPVARALVNKGFVLNQLERHEDAIAIFDEVVERFGGSEESELLEQVAGALVTKGTTLGRANKHEDAIVVFDEVVERFGGIDESELPEKVASALFNKGVALGRLNRSDDEIAVYDEIVERFGDSEHPEILEQVAKALVNKGVTLGEINRHEDALAAHESALRLQPGEPSLAIYGRFNILRELNKEEEAFSYLDEILDSSLPETAGITLSSLLISDFVQDNVRLGRVAEAYISHDSVGLLIGGLVGWIRQSLPISESDARDLEKAEETLMEVFSEITEAKLVLDMLTAARKDALGDPKALLKLPLELRRLIQREKGEEPDN